MFESRDACILYLSLEMSSIKNPAPMLNPKMAFRLSSGFAPPPESVGGWGGIPEPELVNWSA